MITKEYSCPKCGNTISTSIEEKWLPAILFLPITCPECGAASPFKDYKEPINKKYDGRYVLTPVDNGINKSMERIPLHIGSNRIGRMSIDTPADVDVRIDVGEYVPNKTIAGIVYNPNRTSRNHAEIDIKFDEREIPTFTITALDKKIYINDKGYEKCTGTTISIGTVIRLGDLELRFDDIGAGTVD